MNEIRSPLDTEFQRIRDALNVPRDFPAAVVIEAEAVVRRDPLAPEYAAQFTNRLDVPFITIDPPDSLDLDQAFYAESKNDGWLVRYAIDDVGFFIDRGGAIEAEAWRRGTTLYSPDIRTLLYPPALSEAGASLLPAVARPAIVFTLTLDAKAESQIVIIERAVIRSRAKLAYPEVSAHLASERTAPGSGALAGHDWSRSLTLLEEIGHQRQQRETERGGISLRIPAQQVERWSAALTGYRLAFELSSDVEEWNAQISLMTGMAAAQVMISHGAGLLRALDPPRPDKLRALRLTAAAMQIAWPSTMAYDDFVRSLEPTNPAHAVMLHQAAKVTGGARYVEFAGSPPPQAAHSAIAAFYAHVTAPLRRLADRYVLDLLVELSAGHQPEPDLIEALQRLPEVMAAADHASHQLESRIVDIAEAWLMQGRIGQVFNATIIALRADGVVIQIAEPPIRTLVPLSVFAGEDHVEARLHAEAAQLDLGTMTLSLGQGLRFRLASAEIKTGMLHFSIVR